ncbi:hypothetical protein, partial [Sutterella wadsworthensis]|uniref:hypothetical protein n=2 Tax=Sutterella wadsworthensis TaxID=40545 RepID=UPI00307B501A
GDVGKAESERGLRGTAELSAAPECKTDAFPISINKRLPSELGAFLRAQMPLSTYFFTFEYKLESQKEGRRTLLRCSGLFSIDCFFRMAGVSV